MVQKILLCACFKILQGHDIFRLLSINFRQFSNIQMSLYTQRKCNSLVKDIADNIAIDSNAILQIKKAINLNYKTSTITVADSN